MKELRSIDTWGLYTVYHGFQHRENSSHWNLKKILITVFKIFLESLLRRADYEEITVPNLTHFNFVHIVGWRMKLLQNNLRKPALTLTEFAEYWLFLKESKQPGKGKPEDSKSFQVLLSLTMMI